MVNIAEKIRETNLDLVFFEGYEDAVIGLTCSQPNRSPVVAYDFGKCINILMERDGMDQDTALEYFNFNTLRMGLGEKTPIFVDQL